MEMEQNMEHETQTLVLCRSFMRISIHGLPHSTLYIYTLLYYSRFHVLFHYSLYNPSGPEEVDWDLWVQYNVQ